MDNVDVYTMFDRKSLSVQQTIFHRSSIVQLHPVYLDQMSIRSFNDYSRYGTLYVINRNWIFARNRANNVRVTFMFELAYSIRYKKESGAERMQTTIGIRRKTLNINRGIRGRLASIYSRVCSRWGKFCGLSALLD